MANVKHSDVKQLTANLTLPNCFKYLAAANKKK